MGFYSISPTVGVAAGVVLIAVALVYRAMLPKPIPGIPYNKASARRVLGDMPDVLKWHAETKEIWSYIAKMARDLDTPVFQVFMRPFGKPWVITTDFREAEDILVSRSKDFDRSDFFGDLFKPLLPSNQVSMKTGDEWRAHRYLVRDTMSPYFINDVASQSMYELTQEMLSLWRERTRLGHGRAFQADEDLFRSTLDIIWAATFGSNIGSIKRQLDLLSSQKSLKNTLPDHGQSVEFPIADDPPAFLAIRELCDSVELALNSPFPRQTLHFALNYFPYLVRAGRHKDKMIKDRIATAWEKFSADVNDDDQVKSAVDLLIQREAQAAKKESRVAEYDTQALRDELFGFLVAGHEATSTTLSWAMKYLTANQHVQTKLRETLRKVHARAAAAGENPSAAEIAKANIPYLDAVIEENHRLAGTVPAHIRRAVHDTEVLGHRIPAGTDVFMMTSGPGYWTKPIAVEEASRSKSSQDKFDRFGAWDVEGIRTFDPERWLVGNEKGEAEFNPRAGPALPFGAGPRGCFGKKLAVLELKMFFTLVVWNFELQPTPPALSSFNGHDKNTYRPQQVFLQLRELK